MTQIMIIFWGTKMANALQLRNTLDRSERQNEDDPGVHSVKCKIELEKRERIMQRNNEKKRWKECVTENIILGFFPFLTEMLSGNFLTFPVQEV